MTTRILRPFSGSGSDEPIGFMIFCPGCDTWHVVYIVKEAGRPIWTFNGDYDAPTFSPSLLCQWEEGEDREKRRCHSFIRDGKWQYLNDCTHDLAGQTVSIPACDIDSGVTD